MGIMERMRLDGKVAFITGGARGIGRASATAMAEAGSDVVLIDMNIDQARETAAKIAEETGVRTMALKADVTVPEDVDAFIAAILKEFGHIDIAHCNAGIGIDYAAEDMPYDVWKKVMDVNASGIFLSAQAAAKVMLKQGHGSIINTASMSAHIVNVPQKQCNYNASKAAVIQMTKSMAVEFASRGVRVNCISPGYIVTDMIKGHPLIPTWLSVSPIGRLGCAEDLQSAIVYLAGDSCPFTTGCDIVIDGAFTCI